MNTSEKEAHVSSQADKSPKEETLDYRKVWIKTSDNVAVESREVEYIDTQTNSINMFIKDRKKTNEIADKKLGENIDNLKQECKESGSHTIDGGEEIDELIADRPTVNELNTNSDTILNSEKEAISSEIIKETKAKNTVNYLNKEGQNENTASDVEIPQEKDVQHNKLSDKAVDVASLDVSKGMKLNEKVTKPSAKQSKSPKAKVVQLEKTAARIKAKRDAVNAKANSPKSKKKVVIKDKSEEENKSVEKSSQPEKSRKQKSPRKIESKSSAKKTVKDDKCENAKKQDNNLNETEYMPMNTRKRKSESPKSNRAATREKQKKITKVQKSANDNIEKKLTKTDKLTASKKTLDKNIDERTEEKKEEKKEDAMVEKTCVSPKKVEQLNGGEKNEKPTFDMKEKSVRGKKKGKAVNEKKEWKSTEDIKTSVNNKEEESSPTKKKALTKIEKLQARNNVAIDESTCNDGKSGSKSFQLTDTTSIKKSKKADQMTEKQDAKKTVQKRAKANQTKSPKRRNAVKNEDGGELSDNENDNLLADATMKKSVEDLDSTLNDGHKTGDNVKLNENSDTIEDITEPSEVEGTKKSTKIKQRSKVNVVSEENATNMASNATLNDDNTKENGYSLVDETEKLGTSSKSDNNYKETVTSSKCVDVYEYDDEPENVIPPKRTKFKVDGTGMGNSIPQDCCAKRSMSAESSESDSTISFNIRSSVEEYLPPGLPDRHVTTDGLPNVDIVIIGTCRVEDIILSKPMINRGEGNFPCVKCEFLSKRKVVTRKHQFSHEIFQCLYCDYDCGSLDGFYKHGAEVHPTKPGLRTCTKCSLLVRMGDDYRSHVHECGGKSSITCNHCGKDFRYEFRLKTHIQKTHSDMKGVLPQYPCEKCTYQADTHGQLLKHQNTHLDFPCKHCEEVFSSKQLLRKHLVVHAHLLPFVCKYEVCQRGFKSQRCLLEHEALHTDERPHVCGINNCNEAFRTAKSCEGHRNEVHYLTERQLQCQFEGCDQKFYRMPQLKRHENKHNREYKLF